MYRTIASERNKAVYGVTAKDVANESEDEEKTMQYDGAWRGSVQEPPIQIGAWGTTTYISLGQHQGQTVL